MSWTRDQVTMLIECYEEYPCLYVVKHKLYKNKHARTTALQDIAKKLNSIRPNTTIAEIKNKFGAIRTNFLNEHRKHVATKNKSGEGTDDIYQRSIWYYKNMLFILEHSTPKQAAYDSIIYSPEAEIIPDYASTMEDDNSELQMVSWDNIDEDLLEEQPTPSISRASTADMARELPTASTSRASSVDIPKEQPLSSASRTGSVNISKRKGKKRKIDTENAFYETAVSALNKIASAEHPADTNKLDDVNAFLKFLETKLRRITDVGILDDVEEKILQIVQDGYKKCTNK